MVKCGCTIDRKSLSKLLLACLRDLSGCLKPRGVEVHEAKGGAGGQGCPQLFAALIRHITEGDPNILEGASTHETLTQCHHPAITHGVAIETHTPEFG